MSSGFAGVSDGWCEWQVTVYRLADVLSRNQALKAVLLWPARL
jgi:hypothetical protein